MNTLPLAGKQPEDVVPLTMFLATQPAKGPTARSFGLARRPLHAARRGDGLPALRQDEGTRHDRRRRAVLTFFLPTTSKDSI
jgi:hypothetical protein